MQSPIYDYFIIGQGLAGSTLAVKLIEQGQKVLVIDNAHYQSASKIAAGMINPVTGHRLNITDSFCNYIASAKPFYQQLETLINKRVFFDLEQFRLIKNAGQLDYWEQRKQQAAYADILGNLTEKTEFFKKVLHGITEVRQSAFVDTFALLTSVKDYLIQKGAYQEQLIDYSAIELGGNQVTISGLKFSAHNIIFCEGYQAIHNPWLKDLPFKLAKGEILTLENDTAWHNTLFTWGNWLVPNALGQWRLGSNFIWNDTEHTIKKETKQSLLNSLESYSKIYSNNTANVIDHQVGVRPSTVQRKPFVGRSSTQQKILCFNGFGSKGCLLIPFYAELLCQHLLQNKPLPDEVTQCL